MSEEPPARMQRLRMTLMPTVWHALLWGVLIGVVITAATHGLWSAPHQCPAEVCF